MKRKMIILATVLLLLGGVLTVSALAMSGWDLSKLGSGKYETSIHSITEPFSDISVNTETADIIIAPSGDGSCRAVCYVDEKMKHTVSVKDGVLNIKCVDERSWFDRIGFNFTHPKITLYLPEAEYGELKISDKTGDINIPGGFVFQSISANLTTGDATCRASASGPLKISSTTGDITVSDASASELSLATTTGDIELKDSSCSGKVLVNVTTGDAEIEGLSCASFSSDGSTGRVEMENLVATGNISVERSTGDIIFKRCDGAELTFKTSTGDIRGTVLSGKSFSATASTGSVSVPESSQGGRCTASTSTGDINIKIAN
ncbi:MAG: DUF4097 family beta strand repeat protein [Clostridia bacterium]|nr:DUF4097 family beta strand repeat protein [Clostridia bacterium]